MHDSRSTTSDLIFSAGGRRLVMSPFQYPDSEMILRWVTTPPDLRWLAPNTAWPLTQDKIRDWTRRGGEGFVLRSLPGETGVGYGEVNIFEGHSRECWIGHVIVAPASRGLGWGGGLVQGLLWHAFRRRQANRVSLIVFSENVAAVNCYLQAGFEVAGSERHRCADDQELVRLTRLEITRANYASSARTSAFEHSLQSTA